MGTLTPWVTRLLIANFAVFFLQQTFPIIDQLFVLVPRPFTFVQRPWTLVSYMFLHGSFGHIFFNMLVVFFFGPRLESRLGAKQFLWLYFISGIGGALLSFVFAPRFPIIGASAGVFGVMLAFAMFWPREHILLWFVIPVQIRYLVAFMTAFAVVFGFGGARDGIAHFAHLGGFVGAFLYLKWIEKRSPAARFKAKTATPGGNRISDTISLQRWRQIRRENLHEVNQAELDRILDKISADGVQSLTADERSFLERFSLH